MASRVSSPPKRSTMPISSIANSSSSTSGNTRDNSRNPRSRSNTAHSYSERFSRYEEPEPEPEPMPVRPSIRSQGRVMSSSRLESRLDPHHEWPEAPVSPSRPMLGRSQTAFEGPRSIGRATTPVSGSRKLSIPENPGVLRAQLRPAGNRINTGATNNVFGDPSDASTVDSNSPDHSHRERSVSPATSHGSIQSRNASYTMLSQAANTSGRKGPPPPPPSRAKKPPPPPPMKRAEISSSSVGRY